MIYIKLLHLKELVVNFNLISLSLNDIQELDYLRFRILEELLLTEIDIRELVGLSVATTSKRLVDFYVLNEVRNVS